MQKVLFLCLGNICRSPMGEAILQHKIDQRGLSNQLATDSCGTAAYHIGETPDPRTIEVAEKNGVTVSHYCRQLTESDFREFDYIFAMDRSNYRNAQTIQPIDGKAKLVMMRDFDPELGNGEVPDPYYGGTDGFDHVFEILDRSIDNFLKSIQL